MTFKVTRGRTLDADVDVWVALAVDAPGSVAGATLAELREEIEAVKHFCLGLPKSEYVGVQLLFKLSG